MRIATFSFVPRFAVIALITICLAVTNSFADDDDGEGGSSGSPPAGPPKTLVLAWNNLGMHCEDDQFQTFSILPPYNTILAQVIRNDHLVASGAGIAVTYEAVADPSGSINTTSVAKNDFWTHVFELFGVNLPPEHGLAGHSMPGPANTPQPMTFDATRHAYVAEGIPITPIDDAGKKNTYPMMRVVVRDSGTQAILATTDVVLPVSDELTCITCHASNSGAAAQPVGGWVNDANPTKDYRSNILRLHDEQHQGAPMYATLLATAGYSPTGLLATADAGTAILCAKCHASNALPGSGIAGVKPLTEALHGNHASVVDPATNLVLDASEHRAACYLCHPGSTTKCLRGAMGSAVATDGSMAMQCQNCHGSMSAVGKPGRVGWLEQPACQNCHTGTAMQNSGQIRFTNAFDAPGHLRVAANSTFATDANVPSAGFNLYQFSTGHGGLACEACHGSTHAEYPSSHLNDNVQAIQLQGHKGTISECTTCHGTVPAAVNGGPHGMHPVGNWWVDAHPDVAEEGGAAQCRACHGSNYKGSELSRALGPRTLSTGDFGTKHLWQGFQVSCYACHGGPGGEGGSGNHAPKVYDTTALTDDVTAAAIPLKATDSDGNPLQLRIVEQPAHGTVGIAGKTATLFPETGFAGDVSFSFAAWDGKTNSNLGTVHVGVTDASCPAVLTPTASTFDASAASAAIDVALPAQCDWTADASLSPWITFPNGATFTGPQVLPFEVSANLGPARTATIDVHGVKVKITQAGTNSPNTIGQWIAQTVKCPAPPSAAACTLLAKLRILNTGAGKGSATKVRIVLSADTTYDVGDTTLTVRKVKKIATGHGRTMKLKVKLPAGIVPSGMFVLAIVDDAQTQLEQSESDNLAVFTALP